MTPDSDIAVERTPFFLDAGGRRLYAIHFAPISLVTTAGPRRAVVMLAPFAEEMNRSRRMMVLQAESLARVGVPSLLFDYSGTGDSIGEFATARWNEWQSDCDAALQWLTDRGYETVDIVGVRMGAALACLMARRNGGNSGRLVLWQPVVSGSTFLTQFLRIRIAASLEAGAGRETTKELRARFEAGEILEIAGYEIAGALAMDLEAIRLSELNPSENWSVHWFELSAEAGAIMPASLTVLAAWQEAGAMVSAEPVAGQPFWAIQEVTIAPKLIAATTNALTAGHGGQAN